MTNLRIAVDPAVMVGKPCVRGTRLTVELVLRKLEAGHSPSELIKTYPQLTEDDVRAILVFAAG